MKKIRINSKKYGILEILLDDEDYNKIQKDFNNLNWSITKNHNGLYAQKRVNKKNIYLHRYIMNNPNKDKKMYSAIISTSLLQLSNKR